MPVNVFFCQHVYYGTTQKCQLNCIPAVIFDLFHTVLITRTVRKTQTRDGTSII